MTAGPALLLLAPPSGGRSLVVQALESEGYTVRAVDTPSQAWKILALDLPDALLTWISDEELSALSGFVHQLLKIRPLPVVDGRRYLSLLGIGEAPEVAREVMLGPLLRAITDEVPRKA